jgi:translation initiation factor 3 subunit L
MHDLKLAEDLKEPLLHQTKLFLQEVKQQALLSTIRSYLKLYTSIHIKKLADFVEMDEKTFV